MISLEPKTLAARKMMPRIVVGVSTNDFELRATELHFADGSVMRNDFRNGRVNPEIDRAVFKPAVEAGFTVTEPMRRR